MTEFTVNKDLSPFIVMIQGELENYKSLVKEAIGGRDENYIPIYLKGCQICEYMLLLLANSKGYRNDGRNCIMIDGLGVPISILTVIGMALPYFPDPNNKIHYFVRKVREDLAIPKECQEFIRFIIEVRNKAAHNVYVTKEMAIEFAKAMDYFTMWFQEECLKKLELDNSIKCKVNSRFFSLEDMLLTSKPNSHEVLLQMMAEQLSIIKNSINSIDHRTQSIEETLIDIQTNITKLCDKIVDYQSLIEKQIQFAQSDSEVDRLMQAYTDECTSKIVNSIKASHEEQSYELEKRKLIASIGQNAWSKLDDASKMFLISAKVMFNNLILLDDSLDYSGVCLLVTKALEVEMNNRFCRQYLEYLRECHREDYSEYPTPLLGPKGTPLPLDKFTMGSYAFILCCLKKREDTEMQMRKNKKRLLEYTSKCIFKDMTIEDIENKLVFFANKIEDIRLRFRNPAAHTNMIRRCDAEECFSIVLDVEKLLKKMLDSFVA